MRRFASLFLSSLAPVALAGEVTVTATPHNSATTLQPTGGAIDYVVEAVNAGPGTESFRVWTLALLPATGRLARVQGPFEVSLPGGWTASAPLTLTAPPSLPAGAYTMVVVAGRSPTDIWSDDTFAFDKLTVAEPWFPQETGTTALLTSVHFVDATHGWAVGTRNTILRTTDGGDNWYGQVAPTSVNLADVHFANASTGWAVGLDGEILHTDDGGAHWSLQSAPSSGGLDAVHVVDDLRGWAVGGKETTFTPSSRRVLVTEDGGDTWQTQLSESGMSPLRDVHFVDNLHGWAVADGSVVLATDDGGESWTGSVAGPPINVGSVFFADLDHGWIVGSGGTVFATTNGGTSWDPQPSGTLAGLGDVVFADALRGWITGSDDNSSQILATDDGGNTWVAQDATGYDHVGALSVVGTDQVWAVGNIGTILHTRTGGQ